MPSASSPVVEPDWAKLLDYETTIPEAVEALVAARQGPATRVAPEAPRCRGSRAESGLRPCPRDGPPPPPTRLSASVGPA